MSFRKKKEKHKEEPDNLFDKEKISQFAQNWLIAVLVWGLAILITLSLVGQAGTVGKYILIVISQLLGLGIYAVPVVLIFLGYWSVSNRNLSHPYYRTIGLGLSYIMGLGILSFFEGFGEKGVSISGMRKAGGFVGLAIAYLASYLGFWGGLAVLFTLFLVGIILVLDGYFRKIEKLRFEAQKDKEDKEKIIEAAERITDSGEEIEVKHIETKSVFRGSLSQALSGIKNKIASRKREKLIKELEKSNGEGKKNGLDTPESAKIALSEKKENAACATSNKESKRITDENWKMPPLELLKKNSTKAVAEDIKKNSGAIQKTLANFGIPADVVEVNVGPTVTQYAFRPAEGIKLSRITAIQSNLAMSLAAHPIRIEAPIPGRSLVGVEVPNKQKRIVSLRELIENPSFIESDEKLLIAFGEDAAGNYVYSDLAEMPHLLVAGATGSGKSIGINCIIASLLYRNSPRDLRLIMVDPKRVELSLYNEIPHLLTPVIVDYNKVINALKWAVSEMERRYTVIQETMSRNIASYNQKVVDGEVEPEVNKETGEIIEPEYLPNIVLVIDELADLMSSSYSKEVEACIVRLAQMSRAVGIHLVLSTQRPSVNVITGIIKANFPTRIAFQVVSQVDSRTILDMAGAEKLLGKGDMLFLPKESNQPRRIQGAYISEEEVKKIVEHLVEQEPADYNPTVMQSVSAHGEIGDYSEEGEDELYEQALEIVTREKKASTSLLQRHLRIGYARAARIVDLLEKNGVIGPAEGSKPRQVLAPNSTSDTSYESPLEDQAKRDGWGA